MRPAVLLLLVVGLAVAEPDSEPTPPIDLGVQLQLSIDGKRREFYIGEIIPIKLSFSSRTRDRYKVDQAQYDRSGRMNSERFDVSPSDGVLDPLAEYFADGVHISGGLRAIEFLEAKAWAIQLNLNEWIRFTRPGECKLKVSSNRISVVDPKSAFGTSPVTAMSNEVTLKILPSDAAWEKRTYEKAVYELKSKRPNKPGDGYKPPARRAIDNLRYLGTPEATRELVKQMRGERDGFDATCFFGVIASPHRAVARQALEAALHEPDHPVGESLLDALVFMTRRDGTSAGDVERTKNEAEVLAKLVEALPNKRGEAARVSLYTALERDWVLADAELLRPETTQKLVSQLVAIFDELPAQQKETLLDSRWEEIKSPALLPLLKRYAEHDCGASRIAGLALQRWYQLDPATARPFIIEEITRPNPRFSGSALAILPDQTLPEVDDALARQLAGNAFDASPTTATLIERYASAAILPQVLEKLDRRIGQLDCEEQTALLAYVLRVDPVSAKPRIEKAIAAHGGDATGCYRSAISDVAAIQYHPLLEEIAIGALENPDAEIASDAADVLANFGSAAAEPALWHQFEQWCRRWKGHESELMLADVDTARSSTNALRLGIALVTAIATGKSWLTDDAELRQLAAATDVPRLRREVENYLESWSERPLPLTVFSCEPYFRVNVAHYRVSSPDALEERLAQFPRNTEFSLGELPSETEAPCIANIRQRLATHGMIATNKGAE